MQDAPLASSSGRCAGMTELRGGPTQRELEGGQRGRAHLTTLSLTRVSSL